MKEFYIQELCDLENPSEEADTCLEIAGISLQNSQWTLAEGGASGYFFDIDDYLREKEGVPKLAKLLAEKISHLVKSHPFDKIAFIDKGGTGPVGLISISSLLLTLIDKEILVIRPKKKVLKGAIKGNFNRGDNVLIVSDIATTGRTIFEAAEKIWDSGGKVQYALVVIDRVQGAVINLGRKGIELFSLFSAITMREKKIDDLLKTRYNVGIGEDCAPQILDFGGLSGTTTF